MGCTSVRRLQVRVCTCIACQTEHTDTLNTAVRLWGRGHACNCRMQLPRALEFPENDSWCHLWWCSLKMGIVQGGRGGRTECAPVQRFRKHWTTAKAGSEDGSFYNILNRTGIHQWTIAPLQCTSCSITACYLEHAWLYKWRKWAPNACAPAVPSAEDQGPPPAQHTKRLGTLLEVHCAHGESRKRGAHGCEKCPKHWGSYI